jgi:hypothetical protein
MAKSGRTGERAFQGPGADVIGISAMSVGSAPDFTRRDRGPEDEHWAHAFGAPCGRCGRLLEEDDYARRRPSGDWVHERCPASRPA